MKNNPASSEISNGISATNSSSVLLSSNDSDPSANATKLASTTSNGNILQQPQQKTEKTEKEAEVLSAVPTQLQLKPTSSKGTLPVGIPRLENFLSLRRASRSGLIFTSVSPSKTNEIAILETNPSNAEEIPFGVVAFGKPHVISNSTSTLLIDSTISAPKHSELLPSYADFIQSIILQADRQTPQNSIGFEIFDESLYPLTASRPDRKRVPSVNAVLAFTKDVFKIGQLAPEVLTMSAVSFDCLIFIYFNSFFVRLGLYFTDSKTIGI